MLSRSILNDAIEGETASLGRSGMAFDLQSTRLQRMKWFLNDLHEEHFFIENVIAMQSKERLQRKTNALGFFITNVVNTVAGPY